MLRHYGVIIVRIFARKIGAFYVTLYVYIYITYIRRIPVMAARLTCPMRMVRPWPVTVLIFPFLGPLGHAAAANAMDKSP